jgi:integrase
MAQLKSRRKIDIARAAIRARHKMAKVPLDLDDPRVTLVMRGITNTNGKRPQRQAAPAVPALLRRMLASCPFPDSPDGAAEALAARHRAMLLLGFGAGLRRSELVALTVGDVAIVPQRGLTVFVARAKSDQQGEGRLIAIHANPKEPDFCPVVAFQRWLAMRAAGPDWAPPAGVAVEPWRQGRPLFCGIGRAGTLKGKPMADLVVARLLKKAALQAGLDPACFSGHLLRRGLLTDAGDRQENLRDVMRQSRHVKVETALGYMADSEIWQNNITAGVFARSVTRRGRERITSGLGANRILSPGRATRYTDRGRRADIIADRHRSGTEGLMDARPHDRRHPG